MCELERVRNATESSELDVLLSDARTEKERLDQRLTDSQEDLSVAKNQLTKLQQQYQSAIEEIEVRLWR